MSKSSVLALLLLLLVGCSPKALNGHTAQADPKQDASEPSKPAIQHDPAICIAAMDRRVPVLMYHDVVVRRGPGSVWFDTTVAELETQFDWLARHDITPISIDQLYAHLTTGADIPKDSIVLTFDDNGEGFYQLVVPMLHKYKFPAIMFVHTASPTMDKPGRPHMTWDQLRELTKDSLVTIGAHSINHPEDMRQLSEAAARTEIGQSKTDLEKQLGVPINYFAYPNGKYNDALQRITKEAGFKLAFTIETGLAEESSGLYAIHRYERQKLAVAWEERDRACFDAPAAIAQVKLADAPVKINVGVYEGLKIAFVSGGLPSTVLAKAGRQGVTDFVQQSQAAAGINGGFFAMAGLRSTSNVMIGPSLTSTDQQFISDPSLGVGGALLQKLKNRPVIIWGPSNLAIVPYQPWAMNNEAAYREFMPDMTDLFLAGAWLVHDGVARNDEQLRTFASKDIGDPRRRAFLGITSAGQVVIGASLQTCSTDRLGEAAAAAGVQEAVLLDSGFSTSLVFNGKIIVTGHTARDLPSRPVPHAIVIKGQLDLTGADAMIASAAEGAKSPADIEGAIRARDRRRLAALETKRRKEMGDELATLSKDQGSPGDEGQPFNPDPTKPDPGKPDPAKPDPGKPDPGKPNPAKPDPTKPGPGKPDPAKPDPAKPGPTKP